MKKKLTIVILIIFSILYIGDKITSNYPDNPPKLKVKYNGNEFKAELNEYIWREVKIPGQTIGNSNLSVSEIEMAQDMDSIDVSSNDVLEIKLSYYKNISKIDVFEVIKDGEDKKTIPVEFSGYVIKAPIDKGEHVYVVDAIGDLSVQSSHSARYVIKLNVI